MSKITIIKEQARYNHETKQVEFIERHSYDVMVHSSEFNENIPVGTRLTVKEQYVNGELKDKFTSYTCWIDNENHPISDIFDTGKLSLMEVDMDKFFTLIPDGH